MQDTEVSNFGEGSGRLVVAFLSLALVLVKQVKNEDHWQFGGKVQLSEDST